MAPVKNLREAYGQALVALGKQDRHVVALEADLGKSTRSILFQGEFPDRYFEMGIAEQNMASTAAGLALAGKIPFMHSFAVFVSGRTYDQLRNLSASRGFRCGSAVPAAAYRISGTGRRIRRSRTWPSCGPCRG